VTTPVFSETDVRRRLERAKIALDGEQCAHLARFLNLLAKWNRVYNLTGFRQAQDLLERNLVECLQLAGRLEGVRIADVGTGAGLPGVPLAIAEPARSFTLIESRAKRVRFLRHVVGELGLANAVVAHGRAEDLRLEQPFDTVLARAVAAPLELLAIARHLTARGSILLLLTSSEIGAAYRGLAADFQVRSIEALRPEVGHGAVVCIERVLA
jgi:16S rRNA (guanine527-N7)-methyltransferase